MYPRRYYLVLVVPILIILVGTLGYRLIEGWDLLDSLYMTVITLTTVGFNEVKPLTTPGRIFTIFLCLGGIFTLFYAASEIIRAVVSGEAPEVEERVTSPSTRAG